MRRFGLALSIAACGCGVLLLMIHIKSWKSSVSGGEPVSVLVARQALARGEKVSEGAITERLVPVGHLERRAVRVSERDKVVGQRLNVSLQAMDGLLWTDLSLGQEERDLSSLVQPGKRAVTVTPKGGSATSALIRPGDNVDVLSSRRGQGTAVVLEKTLVLAVGTETTRRRSNRAIGSVEALTLSLDLEQTRRLNSALALGTISVVLRNTEDDRVSLQQAPTQQTVGRAAARPRRPVNIGRVR